VLQLETTIHIFMHMFDLLWPSMWRYAQ